MSKVIVHFIVLCMYDLYCSFPESSYIVAMFYLIDPVILSKDKLYMQMHSIDMAFKNAIEELRHTIALLKY